MWRFWRGVIGRVVCNGDGGVGVSDVRVRWTL